MDQQTVVHGSRCACGPPAGRMPVRILTSCLVAIILLGGVGARGESGPLADQAPFANEKPDPYRDQWQVVRPGENATYNQRERLAIRGRRVYDMHCGGCHGDHGDGLGPAAARLIIKPRDFTKGIFKFRSTKQFQLPLEADLHRTITRGLPGVSMPAFPLMAEQDRVAVIEYIKQFYPAWDEDASKREVVYVPRAPLDLMTPDRIHRGRVVYLAMQCGQCHGADGAGMNAAIRWVDDHALGRIAPRNFTQGRFLGGRNPEDIYRTFHTGLGGAMPKFDQDVILYVNQDAARGQADHMLPGEAAQLEPYIKAFPESPTQIMEWDAITKNHMVNRNSWDLVAYVLSLTTNPKPTVRPSEAATPPVSTTPTATEDDSYGY